MAVIAIISAPFSHGEEVSRIVADRLGYTIATDEVLSEAAALSGLPADKLMASLRSGPGMLERFTKEHEVRLAQLRLALANVLQQDNIVLTGDAAYLLPRHLDGLFRFGLTARRDHRAALAVEREQVSMRQAQALLQRADLQRENWARRVTGHAPNDEHLYDLQLPMDEMSPEAAAGQIVVYCGEHADRDDEGVMTRRDLLLACKVWVRLAEKGHRVQVAAHDGKVTISINSYTSRLEALKEQLNALAMTVDGVIGVKSVPGTGFVPPSLLPTPEVSSRVLLVDDEKEFVQSLSERLQTRQFDSTVVYSGEEALDAIQDDVPEVMVLDLKMPGMGGMDVLRKVRQEHPDVAVIILTGHGSSQEQDLAMELGAFAYLTKPVNIEVLASTLREARERVRAADDEG